MHVPARPGLLSLAQWRMSSGRREPRCGSERPASDAAIVVAAAIRHPRTMETLTERFTCILIMAAKWPSLSPEADRHTPRASGTGLEKRGEGYQ